ncbi:MAG: TonB-dependent receptor [Prevotellaceae bacterium]|jgi:TonB-linked SusC/RagA family outer membrane protein|nr:TonB-dependent receptor [Prevotellaceae bacterium]
MYVKLLKTGWHKILLSVCALFFLSGTIWAQNITVTGKVIDKTGEGVPGVYILVDGTRNGTVTQNNGNFTISAPSNGKLVFSSLGYKTLTAEVANRATINVSLEDDAMILEDVVVVGYGTQRRVNLTGAVSTVDVGKTLEARPQADVGKALQGAVPGLTVLNSTGRIDAAPEITIRGVGTLSNNARSNPFILVDGVPINDISYLNTQDIENISVLKDAASTSIYGTRAAFGVILITTKSAKKTDRITINYTNNFSFDTPANLANFPDVATQARALREANTRAGLPNELFGMYMEDAFIAKAEAWKQRHGGKAGYREMIEGDDFETIGGISQYYADWDVVGIMFRKWKPGQSHNISVQGTSGKTSYFMSLGYNHQEGVMTFNPQKTDKYNAMINLTTNVTDWLQVGGRFSFSDRVNTEPYTRRYIYQYMWRWGSFFGPYGTLNGIDANNSIAQLKQAGDDVTNNALTRMGAFLKANIVKGLTLNTDFTYNIVNYNNDQVGLPVYALNTWGGNITGPLVTVSAPSASFLRQQNTRNNSYTFNIYANYAFKLFENHNFNLMVGANAEEGEVKMFWARRSALLDNYLPEFSLTTGDQTVGGSHSHWGAAGWFGRLNYDYNGIWLLELNGRYDGSSKFPVSNRWAFFPSGSVGYRLSEESYFDSLRETVNNAKIRASFGQIGNQEIGADMFLSTISGIAAGSMSWLDASGNKVVGYGLPTMVSSVLKWERIETLNIGLDLGFLKEFNLSADWFQRTTIGMLAPAKTMPQVLGTGAPRVNAGTLQTRGWELSVDWHHQFNSLNVYATANIGDFKTIITEWDNDARLLNQNYSGKVYGDIWGFETDRYFTKDDFNADGTYKQGVASQAGLNQGTFVFGPGDIKFKDLNNDGKIDGGAGTDTDHGDLKVIGNSTPRYQYGFRLGGNWKGFDLDMFFQGVGKRDLWTQGAFVMPMMRGADAIYAHQADYWTEANPNPNAALPRMYPGNAGRGTISVIDLGNHNFYPQTKYLVNMAYLRFKNLTLGYTLPAAVSRKIYMDKVRIYASAYNLCELIKKTNAPVDPELNNSESTYDGTNDFGNGTWGRTDPMVRTVSFGLQITF